MTSDDAYRYPDTDDRITLQFIAQSEPFPGYWGGADERAMSRAARELDDLLPQRTDVHALDAGCGPGRMLPWLSGRAGRITAMDPDANRLAEARQVATDLADAATISLAATSAHELADGPFDLVLCSHIIQHIPTATVPPLLTRLRELTRPGGILMLSYARAPAGADRYSVDRIVGDRTETEWVDQVRFDEVAGGPSDGTALPIHYRDPFRLAEFGASLGWREVWSWSFHALDDFGVIDAHVDRDVLVNGTPELRRQFGRDIVVLWRRDER
jgi:SAM-dependent methyltransferase